MFGRKHDDQAPLDRALRAATGLKPGSWQSVEALASLAVEARGRTESEALYQSALDAAAGLSDGSWDSVRALACLARARRELGPAIG